MEEQFVGDWVWGVKNNLIVINHFSWHVQNPISHRLAIFFEELFSTFVKKTAYAIFSYISKELLACNSAKCIAFLKFNIYDTLFLRKTSLKYKPLIKTNIEKKAKLPLAAENLSPTSSLLPLKHHKR